MRIKEMSLYETPRERLKEFGVESLSKGELLAIILQKGTLKENVIDMSNRLIAKYPKLSDCSLSELIQIPGIGEAKAMQILALFEFSKRFDSGRVLGLVVNRASDVAEHYMEKLKGKKREFFIGVFLDSKNRIIGEKVISIGTLNSSLVHPREVFKEAIKCSANSIILVHNHPSGDVSPSREDEEVVKMINYTGQILDIQVLDHIIIGKQKWYSFDLH